MGQSVAFALSPTCEKYCTHAIGLTNAQSCHITGNVFDRVFSIPYSDRDFIIRAGDYDDVYGTSIPNVHIDPKRQVTYLNNYTNMLPKEIPYAKGINDESNGAIYKFFVTVNILKKW